MIVEGWDLHLYCRNSDEPYKATSPVHHGQHNLWSGQYGGVNKGDAWAQAKADGWRKVKNEDGSEDVLCYRCRCANAGRVVKR